MVEPFVLVVGLGNPGPKYDLTRHNIGFAAIDALASRWGTSGFQKKFHADSLLVSSAPDSASKVLLLKPQTFMNRSGLSVAEAVSFYKLDPRTQVLVVSDDLDLPAGQLRLRLSGGPGGHNGLRSIIECLGTEAFPRLRVGIGRSAQLPADAYVLAKLGRGEQTAFLETAADAALAIGTCLTEGMAKAMNTINQKRQTP